MRITLDVVIDLDDAKLAGFDDDVKVMSGGQAVQCAVENILEKHLKNATVVFVVVNWDYTDDDDDPSQPPPLDIRLEDDGDFFATRETAIPFRLALEKRLQDNGTVVVDMATIRNASHGAIDELIGSIIRDKGPQLLKHITFSGCNSNIRTLINIVIGDAVYEFDKHA